MPNTPASDFIHFVWKTEDNSSIEHRRCNMCATSSLLTHHGRMLVKGATGTLLHTARLPTPSKPSRPFLLVTNG